MKKELLLFLTIILFSEIGFSQNQFSFKIFSNDQSFQISSLTKKSDLLNFNFLNDKSDEKSDFKRIFSNSNKEEKTEEQRMPIYNPKGSFKLRIAEIDSTRTYFLRVFKPN